MENLSQILKSNKIMLKSHVSRYALYGLVIALTALLTATLLASYFQYGAVSLVNIINVQKINQALWFLDVMPFIFVFWGQYASSRMAFKASVMILEQTSSLRDQTIALEYRVAHEATHDAITGLPNRILLMDRVEQAIKSALNPKTRLAVIIIAIDNFKEINETLGHHSGDLLLKQAVSRLQIIVRKSDTLASIGNNEIAILLPVIKDIENVINIMKKIEKLFLDSFSINRLFIEIQVSIGTAIYPDHGKDMDSILQRANLALYSAKSDNRKFKIYSSDMEKNSPRQLTLTGELRQAIANDQLLLQFQPKIDAHSKRVTGAEALVSWHHPVHGMLLPDEFIPMAEQTGLIQPLSIWVLNNALRTARNWYRESLGLSIAINISPTTFLDLELPDLIIDLLSQYEIPSDFIILEITEGSMIKNPDLALEILNRLSDRGIKISIDDFGTGYSSLSYLKQLPASEIKIDKSFVQDMLTDENDAVIVKAIIDLGHNLGLNVVAEGVENSETSSRLKSLGCDVLQGYYFSKPVKSDRFLKWLSLNSDY